MKKATHDGECQVCGRRQKLPEDLLSAHGYAVKWSQFVGTCPGSHELPFEKANALAERYRDDAIDATVRYRLMEKNALAAGTQLYAGIHQRQLYGRPSRTVWVKVFITLGEPNRYPVVVADEDFSNDLNREGFMVVKGTVIRSDLCGLYGAHTLEDAEVVLRKRYASGFAMQAKGQEDYVKWMDGRLKGWKVKPLKKRSDR